MGFRVTYTGDDSHRFSLFLLSRISRRQAQHLAKAFGLISFDEGFVQELDPVVIASTMPNDPRCAQRLTRIGRRKFYEDAIAGLQFDSSKHQQPALAHILRSPFQDSGNSITSHDQANGQVQPITLPLPEIRPETG